MRHFASPEVALRIRDFIREYMELDEHSVGKPNDSYVVHTIYLDSDDWKIYWQTIQRDQDRWKLRLRYYDDHPDSPVFCEVKQQMTDVMVKYRAAVNREALPRVLAGDAPHPAHLSFKNPKQSMAVERFVALLREFHARPKLHISWLREAYVTYDDRGSRVTMDRQIAVREVSNDLLATRMDDPLVCMDHAVILELRFPERFPDWWRELVRIFNLRESFPSKPSRRSIALAGLHLSPDDVINNIVL